MLKSQMDEYEIRARRVELLKKKFASTEDWVKHWLSIYFHNTSYMPTVFYSSDGFMNLKGLMSEVTTTDIDSFGIYCTDKLSNYVYDKDGEYRRITFYVCHRADDPNDQDECELARMRCMEDVNEFRKFLKRASYYHNPNVFPCMLRECAPAESGAPFLDGWESMRVQLEYFSLVCAEPTWARYNL